jgi:hypothetical protein
MQGPELAFLFQRQQARVAPEDSTLDRAIGSVTGDAAASAAGEPTVTMTLQERAEAAA